MAASGNRTILGPLTTTYTAPSSCSVAVLSCQTCSTAWQGQSCFASTYGKSTTYGFGDNTECWPPRSSFVSTPLPALRGWGFYSPGLACPSGMTTACSATGGGSSDWPVQFGLLEQETAVGCCPSGYFCSVAGPTEQTCVQLATSTFQAVTCQSGTSGGLAIPVTVMAPRTALAPTTASTAAISQYTLYAPLIQLNWQSTDLHNFSAISTSTPTSSINSSISLSTATPTPESILSSASGLSPSTKVGIGVVVTLVVLALAVLALAFFIYSTRQKAAHARGRRDSSTDIQPTYKLNDERTGQCATAGELTRQEVSELSPVEKRKYGEQEIYEMEVSELSPVEKLKYGKQEIHEMF